MPQTNKKTLFQKYIRPLTPLPTALTPTGQLRENIRCVLFDIYGTLFISGSGDIGSAAQASARLQGIDELLAKYGIHKNARVLLDEFHDAIQSRHAELKNKGIDFPEVRIDKIWQQVLQIRGQETVRQFALEFELMSNPAYPMPNLANLLSACRREKISMGIISNAQFYTACLFRWFLNARPEELGFNADFIFYSYRYEIAKPAPSLFEMAAASLAGAGIPPSAVLYLGNDMLNDIYPARNAGFQTALFAGDRRSLRLRRDDPRCKNLAPDLVVTDLSQLIQHLEPRV
ncbi:MAG: HAD family hydrolase [Desulfobacterales bacterium]